MSGRQAKAAVTADHITQKKQLVPLMLLLLLHLLLGLFHNKQRDPFRHVCGDVSGGGGLGDSEEEALRVSACTAFDDAKPSAVMSQLSSFTKALIEFSSGCILFQA